jgi:hypothetical protein
MEIRGMFLHYWIIMFSCWVSANVMGLVISDSFRTVVTIYITIPFLVIPQIILSGVIVKYEKLNPHISSPDKIPWYGEIMTARWGYEALAVHQFKENKYMQMFYYHNKVMSVAEYKKYYWVKNLENKVDFLEKYHQDEEKADKVETYLNLLRNEISKETDFNSTLGFDYISSLYPEKLNAQVIQATRDYIRRVNKLYIRAYNRANDERDEIIRSFQGTAEDKEKFIELKRDYHNDRLAEFVENSNEPVRIVEYKGHLIQKLDPIYLDPESKWIKAHFYAPRKKFLNTYYNTFWVNTVVIWLMSLILFIILYFRGLRKLLDSFEHVRKKSGEAEKME